MSISQRARAYAEAIDRLEVAKNYIADGDRYIATFRPSVTWMEGSSLPGYAVLSSQVSKLVSAQMIVLVNAAIADLEKAVRLAERHLTIALAEEHDKVGAT